ncbi:hypothetical protein [Pantoea sp. DY-5]|uniref:hypothetical protein n=1 Tax=Pantoea sp. DY-5 TaxID=2871488 RepID=UPI001C98B15B|nr:hypothetical protein [Pantoea sp. DY-5]MBY4837524.1 hypothetical protein [Pantoea sp. DY-5]
MIKALKADPDNMELILELHRFLIRKIVSEEKRIKRLKRIKSRFTRIKKGGRLTKDDSIKIKGLLNMIEPRLKARRVMIYTWKFFGDGIANIYQPTCNLKHLYYDSNYNVKEDAGFISGKEGFKNEWKIFRMGLDKKVPVILSDITNVIRHGDVCAMGWSDPVPIEVKKTKHANPGGRVNRQLRDLKKLALFYGNDYAPNFRNGFDAYRVAKKGRDVAYYNEINLVIRNALEDGYSSMEVERGLTYFCSRITRGGDVDVNVVNYLESVCGLNNSVMVHELTPEEDWGVAYPFTLSLENECLVAFIQNEISILILTNLEEVRREFFKHGVFAKFIMDGQSAIQISLDENDLMKGAYRIGEQYFNREVIGFNSVKAFVESSCVLLKELPEFKVKDADFIERAISFDEALMEEWKNAKDVLIDARLEIFNTKES